MQSKVTLAEALAVIGAALLHAMLWSIGWILYPFKAAIELARGDLGPDLSNLLVVAAVIGFGLIAAAMFILFSGPLTYMPVALLTIFGFYLANGLTAEIIIHRSFRMHLFLF